MHRVQIIANISDLAAQGHLKEKKSDTIPEWSGMSFYCLNVVEDFCNRFLRIGIKIGSSVKHHYTKLLPVIFGLVGLKLQFCHDRFFLIGLKHNKVLYFLDVVLKNGHDLEKIVIAGFFYDCVQIAFRLCTVIADTVPKKFWYEYEIR